MCGRYTITISIDQLMLRYDIDDEAPSFHRPRYNVAPFQYVPAIINDGRKNRVGELRWGLIPSWSKDEKIASKTINARSETLTEKASFKHIISRKRCIIPADSFYEWKEISSGKQPLRIMMKNKRIFSMAGLYDTWENSKNGEKLNTFTIITTAPNRIMEDIHDRMPVILKAEDESKWLDRKYNKIPDLLSLLKPYNSEEMCAYPVSNLVNNAKNDTHECIVEYKYEQGDLFELI